MNEMSDIHPDVNVREAEYKRLLGYPDNYELKDRSRELADWTRQWYNQNGKPWVYSFKLEDIKLSDNKIEIGDSEFTSQKFLEQLKEAGATSVFIVAVSAGEETELKARQLWQEGKPDEYFFLEVYGSAVTEHLLTQLGFGFCEWADNNNVAVLPHYSPGYPGWDISDQKNLFDLINLKCGNKLPSEMKVLESGMLYPKKSQLAVFGITKNIDKVRRLTDLIPCETCSMFSCRYRRAPFKYARSKFENVRELQPLLNKIIGNSSEHNFPLTSSAKYSIGIKALQKWSDERLEIETADDGSVSAKFRYNGTTCSNLGHELVFDYKVELGSVEKSFTIKSLECKPVGNGYTFMCDYKDNPDLLMNSIDSEKPFLGKPLNEILNWKRDFNPEGCYCKKESRDYKWGQVLETLHYKLVQIENSKPEKENETAETSAK